MQIKKGRSNPLCRGRVLTRACTEGIPVALFPTWVGTPRWTLEPFYEKGRKKALKAAPLTGGPRGPRCCGCFKVPAGAVFGQGQPRWESLQIQGFTSRPAGAPGEGGCEAAMPSRVHKLTGVKNPTPFGEEQG